MDKNSIIGLVLIFLILIGFAWYNQPSEAQLQAIKQQQDSISLVKRQADSLLLAQNQASATFDSIGKNTFDTAAAKATYGTFASFSKGEEQFVMLENAELLVTFTNKGGRIYSVKLKNQKRFDKTDLILFTGDNNRFTYSFNTADGKTINTQDLYFTPVISADGKSIDMRVTLADGQYIEQHYALVADNNQMLDYKLNMVGLQQTIAASTNHIDLNWQQHIIHQEKNFENEVRTTTVYYKTGEDEPDFISESKEEKGTLPLPRTGFLTNNSFLILPLLVKNHLPIQAWKPKMIQAANT
jgi:YidC/Oxa1 family membrane protein insertase